MRESGSATTHASRHPRQEPDFPRRKLSARRTGYRRTSISERAESGRFAGSGQAAPARHWQTSRQKCDARGSKSEASRFLAGLLALAGQLSGWTIPSTKPYCAAGHRTRGPDSARSFMGLKGCRKADSNRQKTRPRRNCLRVQPHAM